MGFLDSLQCVISLSTVISTVISLLQKQSAGSNLKGWLCVHADLRGKYLNKLENIFWVV